MCVITVIFFLSRSQDAIAAGQTRRKDDNAAGFYERLREYYKKTAPLTGYYYAKGMLKTVDGMDTIEGVTSQIEKILGEI